MRYSYIFFGIIIGLFAILGCSNTDNSLDIVTGTETSLGTIQGDVYLIDGVPIQVNLLKDNEVIHQTVAEGSFEFTNLTAGNYTIRLIADGYDDYEVNVEISIGGTVSLEKISLTKQTLPVVEDLDLPPQSTELPPGEGLTIGVKAPDFELPNGDGDLYTLSDYIGEEKRVVLVFYRTGG
ncbi:redoxin domain-containing protein [Candidatus Poribacteria bacterium]|nr:redoxin domain-containing protein [Candidatus Poribacteria bacterium]